MSKYQMTLDISFDKTMQKRNALTVCADPVLLMRLIDKCGGKITAMHLSTGILGYVGMCTKGSGQCYFIDRYGWTHGTLPGRTMHSNRIPITSYMHGEGDTNTGVTSCQNVF